MKYLLVCGFSCLLFACNKIEESRYSGRSVSIDSVNTKINELAEVHLRVDTDQNSTVLRINNPKTVALADAVGGAIAGGTATWSGLGAVFAPYAVVWGAYWFSRGVADVSYNARSINPSVPAGLEFHNVGLIHNDLIFRSYQNGEFPLLQSGSLNSSSISTLLGYQYNGFANVDTFALRVFFRNNIPHMIDMVNAGQSVVGNGSDELYNVISTSNLTVDTKQVLTTITTNILNWNSSLESLTDYCIATEAVVNQSNLDGADKVVVKQFIAILHASSYFWSE